MFKRKYEARLCDNCKYYSYNNPEIKDKVNLVAYCNKEKKETTPWDYCGKFKMIVDGANK